MLRMNEDCVTEVTTPTRFPTGSARRHTSWAGVALLAVCAAALLFALHRAGQTARGITRMDVVAVSSAAVIVVHGRVLGRPFTALHAGFAGALVLTGVFIGLSGHPGGAILGVVAAAVVFVWPSDSRYEPAALEAVSVLVDQTRDDPLAPFAMAPGKSYVFSGDGAAAVAYRAVAGFAVVSGDPIGDPARYGEVVGDFAALCRAHGWRIVVLGASAHQVGMWQSDLVPGPRLRAISFGRDVVVDVDRFDLVGRSKRNLRQAVNRSHNAHVTTEVVMERDLDDALKRELLEVIDTSHKNTHRGFSMMLGRALSGRYRGVLLIIARGKTGRVEAFQRYVSAGNGSDLSLDLPWRRPDAPNGVDERLAVDMIAWAKEHGFQRVSLSFAPFPDLFASASSNAALRILRLLAHAGDRVVKLESLYRYLRKFDAMSERRYVLLPLIGVLPAAAVLLALEFAPHRDLRD